MRKLSWCSALCALAWGGMVLVASNAAAAQDCMTDADCADGLVCTSYGEVSCGFACPESDPDCAAEPACEPIELKQCALPGCETDADCPAGTVCHAETYTVCADSAQAECPPGADCPQPEAPPEPANCATETTEPTCVPQYQLPCATAEDCGAGFDCVELVSVSCSGGGASDPGSGGGSSGFAPPSGEPAPPPLPPETCTEEPSGEFYCDPQEVWCVADADCPESWTCADNPERPVCSAPAEQPAPDGSAGSGAGDAAPLPPPDCGVTDVPEKVCVPPYSGIGFGFATRGGEILQAGVASDDAQDATGSGQASSTPPPDGKVALEEGAEMEPPKSSGGCAVAAAGAGHSGLHLLGLLGLCVLGLRRRTRRAS